MPVMPAPMRAMGFMGRHLGTGGRCRSRAAMAALPPRPRVPDPSLSRVPERLADRGLIPRGVPFGGHDGTNPVPLSRVLSRRGPSA